MGIALKFSTGALFVVFGVVQFRAFVIGLRGGDSKLQVLGYLVQAVAFTSFGIVFVLATITSLVAPAN